MTTRTTTEFVVGWADTLTPVSALAPRHTHAPNAFEEARARAKGNPTGPGYVVITREVTPWRKAET